MTNERTYWLDVLERLSSPVLNNLASRTLKAKMPFEGNAERLSFTHLEAIARLLAGISPWLEQPVATEHEAEKKVKFRTLARVAIDAATDPVSPDFMNYCEGNQPLVDAAFLAHAVIRAPNELWRKLESNVKQNFVNALKSTRKIKPHFNNWLLFSAMVETALFIMEEDVDTMRIDYALRQHEQWYKGDGVYGDGPEFHWDYYNSFVIQPMLVDIIKILGHNYNEWSTMRARIISRAQRYAEVLERIISPEGTFPPIGRSLAYRLGAFQLLSQMALANNLPPSLIPGQVRCALTAVMKRTIEMPGTFDENGWLQIGFCGHQLNIGESYISTGSLYLCGTILLPLGLGDKDEFWKPNDFSWSAKKAWEGLNIEADNSV